MNEADNAVSQARRVLNAVQRESRIRELQDVMTKRTQLKKSKGQHYKVRRLFL